MDAAVKEDFYNKVCAASGLKFTIDKADINHVTQPEDKFASSLATIFARDKEIVAVKLTISDHSCKVYLSKNGDWLPQDKMYVRRIKTFLMDMSKNAPMSKEEAMERKDVKDLYDKIIKYCSVKIQLRIEKIKNDIRHITANYIIIAANHIIDLNYFTSQNIVSKADISKLCMDDYKKIKNNNDIPAKFLRHIKKVGSYATSFDNIIGCVCLEKYKTSFSNIEIEILPHKQILQPINSWKNIIQEFIPNYYSYFIFKYRCLINKDIKNRLKKIYNNKQHNMVNMYLHAEMNILTHIMKHEKEKNAFIAVSKSCCYLCELYINHANDNGYRIITAGAHKKIYHKWMLPSTDNKIFDNNSMIYIQERLEQIIGHEIRNLHVELMADSDSEGNSPDSEDGGDH